MRADKPTDDGSCLLEAETGLSDSLPEYRGKSPRIAPTCHREPLHTALVHELFKVDSSQAMPLADEVSKAGRFPYPALRCGSTLIHSDECCTALDLFKALVTCLCYLSRGFLIPEAVSERPAQ